MTTLVPALARSLPLLPPFVVLGIAAVGVFSPRAVLAQNQAGSSSTRQATGTGELAEITVTAQRRSENLQDVPIAVEAFSVEQLKASAVTSVTDLGVVTPGLVPADEFGYFQPHLRGIGTTAVSASVENPVATYVDGVYYGVQGGSILSLSEGIDHIEVDKGPQGTLFGRNATGGLIQIVTKNPEQQFSATVDVTGGNYATFGTSMYATGGWTPTLASNISLYFQDQGQGYGRNYFNGLYVNKTDDVVVREKNLFTPTERDTLVLAFHYSQDHSSPVLIPAPGTTPFGGVPYTGSPWSADGYYQPLVHDEQGSITLKATHDFGFASLDSNSAYLQNRLYVALDGTLITNYAYAVNIPTWDLNRQITQEFDLRSAPGSTITWTVGVYYYKDTAELAPISLVGGYVAPLAFFSTYSRARNWSFAPFGQASKEILAGTTLTLGIRETHEDKKFSAYQEVAFPVAIIATGAAEQKSNTPTWRVALDHKFSSDALVYASYSRGFKTGGYNDEVLPVATYKPETLDAYELGAKTDSFSNHLRVNASAFHYNYKNLQTVGYPGGTETISNAPGANLDGVDLDIQAALSSTFTFSFGLEGLRAIYRDFPGAQLSYPVPGGGSGLATFNAIGNQLPLAPKWTADLAPLWTIHLSTAGTKLALGATYSYNSGFYYEPDNRLRQGQYSVVNVSALWSSMNDRYNLRAWGKNLSNKAYTTAMYAQQIGDYAQYAPPRTYGVTLTRKF